MYWKGPVGFICVAREPFGHVKKTNMRSFDVRGLLELICSKSKLQSFWAGLFTDFFFRHEVGLYTDV